jgi:cytidylate kinase
MIIAIDGPSASGKSTTAKGVAEKLGILHLDTGAMYRAITLEHLRSLNISFDSPKFIDLVKKSKVNFNSKNQITLNGLCVENDIRRQDVTSKVSEVSAVSIVREKMVEKQREIANNTDCVIEGRDIGSVVFPNAEFKFYLDAKTEIRAARRMKELMIHDESVTLDDLITQITRRDFLDANREISPLIKTKDAIIVDTSSLDVDEQIAKIVKIVNNK